jgi:ATP-dependent RNA helicase RhlE
VKALSDFKDGRVRVLVATDIAARGIDISHVAHVINYDLPQVPEDYIHRIGRTARAGRAGEAMSFISSDDMEQWKNIEKLLFKKGIASSLKIIDSRSNVARPQAPAKPKNGYPKQQQTANPSVKTAAAASTGKIHNRAMSAYSHTAHDAPIAPAKEVSPRPARAFSETPSASNASSAPAKKGGFPTTSAIESRKVGAAPLPANIRFKDEGRGRRSYR